MPRSKVDLSTIDYLGIKNKRVIRQILKQTGKQVLSTLISHYNEALSLILFQLDELLDMISRSTILEIREFILKFTDSQALSDLKLLTLSIFDSYRMSVPKRYSRLTKNQTIALCFIV